MHTLLSSRNGWHYLVTCITVLALLLPGCAKPEKKDVDPTPPIPLPSVELSVIPAEKPSGPPKQTGSPPLLLPPSEELRLQIGRIRFSDRREQPELEFSKPVGAGEGAAKGAGMGLLSSLGAMQAGPVGLFLVPVIAPFTMAYGTVLGVQESQPEAKIEQFENTYRTTIQELNVSQILRQHVAERIRVLQVCEITGASEPAALVTLEIVVKKIRLYHIDWFAPHTFAFTGSTRLLRTTDGEELYSHAFTTTGRNLPLEEWFVADAAKLRQEVDRCCRELAESIVEEIFLLYLPEKEFLFFRPEKQEE